MSQVKISIITATKNSGNVLQSCLDSVARQKYSNYEHIIIDSLSTDNTSLIIQNNINSKIKFISEFDNGIYDALNKGINYATGDVIGFLHSDDFFASDDVLSTLAEFFVNSDVCAVYADLEYVNKFDTSKIVRFWKSKIFRNQNLYWGWMPPHPTLYVRKSFYSKIGGFDLRYKISSDYDSIFKLFLIPGFKSIYVPKTLIKMRLGGISNRSFKSIKKKMIEDWKIMRVNNLSFLKSVFCLLHKNISKLWQFRF